LVWISGGSVNCGRGGPKILALGVKVHAHALPLAGNIEQVGSSVAALTYTQTAHMVPS